MPELMLMLCAVEVWVACEASSPPPRDWSEPPSSEMVIWILVSFVFLSKVAVRRVPVADMAKAVVCSDGAIGSWAVEFGGGTSRVGEAAGLAGKPYAPSLCICRALIHLASG